MADSYTKVTRGVRVSVRSFYLEEQSDPARNRFVWAYRIVIANEGTETVQLTHRTWRITDNRGRTEHVHGPGVVGETPVLAPGETFEYTSGCPLETPSGFMSGHYHMISRAGGEAFQVVIPTFSLDSPHQGGQLH